MKYLNFIVRILALNLVFLINYGIAQNYSCEMLKASQVMDDKVFRIGNINNEARTTYEIDPGDNDNTLNNKMTARSKIVSRKDVGIPCLVVSCSHTSISLLTRSVSFASLGIRLYDIRNSFFRKVSISGRLAWQFTKNIKGFNVGNTVASKKYWRMRLPIN